LMVVKTTIVLSVLQLSGDPARYCYTTSQYSYKKTHLPAVQVKLCKKYLGNNE
jgi:hypothetical protein